MPYDLDDYHKSDVAPAMRYRLLSGISTYKLNAWKRDEPALPTGYSTIYCCLLLHEIVHFPHEIGCSLFTVKCNIKQKQP